MFFRSTHNGAKTKHTWGTVIQLIDAAILDLYDKFDNAFAEGLQEDLGHKETIKQMVFRGFWKQLRKHDALSFDNIDELDQAFIKFHQELPSRVAKFCKQSVIQSLMKGGDIAEPVSKYKMNMLRDIISLYHSFMRSKFELVHLATEYSPVGCTVDGEFYSTKYSRGNSMVQLDALKEQCVMTKQQIWETDLANERYQYLDPLIQMNSKVIDIIYRKGYGQITVDGMIEPSEDSNTADYKYQPLFASLSNGLPGGNALSEVIKRKPDAQTKEQAKKAVQQIEATRLAMLEFSEGLLTGHNVQARELEDRCDVLRQVIANIRDNDQYAGFFESISQLESYQDQPLDVDFALQPGLKQAADRARDSANNQSLGAKLLLRDNGWNTASKCVVDWANKVAMATNDVIALYAKAENTHDEAMDALDAIDKDWLRKADALLTEWDLAAKQSQTIFMAASDLMQAIQARLHAIQQSTLQHLWGFVKRHWPKSLVGGVLTAGGGAAVAFTVLSGPVAAAVLIPAGLMLGGAGGAGLGLIVDEKKKSKPAVKQVKQTKAIKAQSTKAINQREVLGRLFKDQSADDLLGTDNDKGKEEESDSTDEFDIANIMRDLQGMVDQQRKEQIESADDYYDWEYEARETRHEERDGISDVSLFSGQSVHTTTHKRSTVKEEFTTYRLE